MPSPVHLQSRCPAKAPRSAAGFTLVEMLTVVAVLSVLIAILVPVTSSVMAKVHMGKSQSNLHSIGQALGLYAADHNDLIPAPMPGAGTGGAPSAVGSSNPFGLTWQEELLPYLDGVIQQSPGGGQASVTKWSAVLEDPEYVAQNDGISDVEKRGYGMNVYLYRADPRNVNVNTPFYSQRQKWSNMPNPSNNVIMGTSNDYIMEPGIDGVLPQSNGKYTNGDPARFGGVGLFLMVDGSVQTLDPQQAGKILAVPTEMR